MKLLSSGINSLPELTGIGKFTCEMAAWLSVHRHHVPASVKRIMFVLNSGDFGNKASSWACELTHPLTQPEVALWYVVNKYVHAFEPCGAVPAALRMPDGELASELAAFMALHGGKTSFVLYPDRAEAADAALTAAHFAAGESLLKATGATRVLHVQQEPRWGVGYYKDGFTPRQRGLGCWRALLATIWRGLSGWVGCELL